MVKIILRIEFEHNGLESQDALSSFALSKLSRFILSVKIFI